MERTNSAGLVASGRVRYEDAGAATRASIGRALHPTTRPAGADQDPATAPELRVLLALISLVTSYSKVTDDVANLQIQEVTGMDDRAVRRALRGLGDKGVIHRVPGESPRGGRRKASRVALDSTPRAEGTPGPDNPGSRGTPGQDVQRPRVTSTRDPGSPQPASEKYSEKYSEGAPAPACPQCNGPMHVVEKQSPKSPDFRCNDNSCRDASGLVTAVWGAPPNGGSGRPGSAHQRTTEYRCPLCGARYEDDCGCDAGVVVREVS